MKLRSGRKTVNDSSFIKVQNKISKKKNKRQSGRKSGKAKKNRRKSSEVNQLNHISPLLINKQPFVDNTSTPFLNFSSPSSVNIFGSVNNTSCSSNNKPAAIDTPVLAACNANSSMNSLSLISNITMAHYINDSSSDNAIEDHTPLIVDVTNSAIDTSRRKRKRAGSSIVGNILNKETNSCDQEKVAKESVKALHCQISAESSKGQDDDSSSVVCVNSDDEIMIVEKDSSSDLPPSKLQKKDIPVVDLCTPEVPSHQNRIKYRNKNWEKWAKERRHFQYNPHFNVLSSNADSVSVFHHSTNGVIQNNLHHTSKHAFKQYSSILGNTEKKQPVPSCSATVTSSTCDKSGPGYVVDNSGSHSVFGTNMYNPNPTKQEGLRPIVIDGSNVALGHSNGAYFSCQGLLFCIEYFLKRNHKVLAFVPKFRKTSNSTKDPQILDVLEKKGLVSFTPSRRIGSQLIVPYDDRYIVQYAAEKGGVIVSTDNFRDLVYENQSWKETIEKRLLMFTWAGDVLMFPQDPLGRHGPRLEEFLRFPDS